ncbi:hypothetical protein QFC20_006280 [Naganishia adeliensis]|uniref:Uncharacterized protein n=1 Tax=Naganishia adeliensis TaxID=92952 RepID=A0ACC2VD91_9TREE|nr:hypothetical protein QFC20_006280 [Naganishia adeliensis]
MSSQRTSSRTKTVTPGRSVTTLNNPATTSSRNGKSGPGARTGKTSKATRREEEEDDTEPESELSEEDHDEEDVYRGSEEDEVIQEDSPEEDEVDSDDIDEPSNKRAGSKRKNGTSKKPPAKKQKLAVNKATSKPVKTSSAAKTNGKSKAKAGDNYPSAGGSDAESERQGDGDDYSSYSDGEGDGDSDESLELEEGQEIKGYVRKRRTAMCMLFGFVADSLLFIYRRIFSAPKTGHVPPGRISRNTFKFLVNLQDPEKNDREWFKMREPAYRLAEQEWKDFVSILARRFREVDPELPILPPKDLIHRIYRDVRFSNDKTPYKKHFSMSISRSGRKGIWAGLQPRGRSLIAGGVWGPGKNELASIRHAIKTDSSQLRSIISAPDFTKLFGPASPDAKSKGGRCNVFGHDDQLKVAPKGVAKDHKDIDLLKLRSIAVVKKRVLRTFLLLFCDSDAFTDEEVLSPDFMDILLIVASKIQPLAQYLNSVIALPAPAADEAA